nr:MAG TPA: Prokaryotic Ubiquitin [Caudoviricetes sp.]
MALQINNYKRVFKHGSATLADPNPEMSPEEVMNFYSNQYPELTTSNVHGPKIDGDSAVYTFKTTVGTKG